MLINKKFVHQVGDHPKTILLIKFIFNSKFCIFVFFYNSLRESDYCLIKLPKLEALLENKRYCLKIQLRLRVHLLFVYSRMTLKIYVLGDSTGNIQPLCETSVRPFVLN